MISEQYVSFETAKLLKENGFDEVTYACFTLDGEDYYGYRALGSDIMRPTLQMAMKWLREVHNLHCVVDYDFVLGWYCQITSLKETVEYDYEEMKHYHPSNDHGFSSAEKAYEVAIKYCLENLI